MAKRISQLPEETSVATGDQVPIYDASTGTTKRATVTNMLAGVKDGTLIANDAILARHINWAGTGADGGIWWEELGRTTLGSAGDTITVNSLPSRKFLKVLVSVEATGGNVTVGIRCNNDSGSNYARRLSTNNSAEATAGSQTSLVLGSGFSNVHFAIIDILNIASKEKIIRSDVIQANTAGAGNVPSHDEGFSKWANTSAAISRIDIINGGAGDFAIGSELIVLGHD